MRTKSSTIIESELYTRLSLISGHGKDVVRDVIRSLSELVIDELAKETPIRLGKIGEISVIHAKRCGGFNFKNNKVNPTKIVRNIRFKPSVTLKRAIKDTSVF